MLTHRRKGPDGLVLEPNGLPVELQVLSLRGIEETGGSCSSHEVVQSIAEERKCEESSSGRASASDVGQPGRTVVHRTSIVKISPLAVDSEHPCSTESDSDWRSSGSHDLDGFLTRTSGPRVQDAPLTADSCPLSSRDQVASPIRRRRLWTKTLDAAPPPP